MSAPAAPFGWRALPGAILLAILAGVLLAPLRVHHDCAVYIQCGGLLLDGNLPYVDFIDVNPPLIMYLNVVPVLVARFLRVSPVPVFSLCVLALAAFSVSGLRTELRRARPVAGDMRAEILTTLWAGFTLYVWVVGEFGQREHLFTLLYFPFLVARWNRWTGAQLPVHRAAVLGLAAGVGVCIKPYFALIALFPEVYWVLVHRRLKPLLAAEVSAAASVGAAYALHFFLLPSAVFEAWFHRWLPFIVLHYSVYDQPLAMLVAASIVVALVVSLAALIDGVAWRVHVADLPGALAACNLAAITVYFVQHKGWYYQRLPMLAGMVLLGGCIAARGLALIFDRLESVRSQRVALGALLAVGWLVLAVSVYTTIPHIVRDAERGLRANPFVKRIERYTRAGERVLVVSTSVWPAYPTLVQTDRQPGSRYLEFLSIPMLYDGVTATSDASARYHRMTNASPEERQFLRELAEDILVLKPPLIFIHARPGCQACPPRFNLLEYLLQTGVMEASMQEYFVRGNVMGYATFVRGDHLRASKPKLRNGR